jgi:hypothetical protein
LGRAAKSACAPQLPESLDELVSREAPREDVPFHVDMVRQGL